MSRVSTAFRAFFGALFNPQLSARIQDVLEHPTLEVSPSAPAPASVKPVEVPRPPVVAKPKQSEAVTLLATLQREARLIDFLKEDLSNYADEQVGAAVREIHRESASVLNRLFAIRPILGENEGSRVTVPAGFDAARYRLTGKVSGDAPFQGTLQHHGWEVSKCEIPEYVGGESGATTISPAEVEIG